MIQRNRNDNKTNKERDQYRNTYNNSGTGNLKDSGAVAQGQGRKRTSEGMAFGKCAGIREGTLQGLLLVAAECGAFL